MKNSDKADDLDYITEHILAKKTTQKSAGDSMTHPGGSVNTLMATPKSNVVCVNLICVAANRVGHIIDNCFWPGGSEEANRDNVLSGGLILEVSLLIHPLL